MSGDRLLAERRILLFGPSDLDSVARHLRDVGADVQRFELAASGSTRSLESWISELIEGAFDDVLFLTGQGVRVLVEFAHQRGREDEVLRALSRARIAAAGSKTRAALAEIGLRPTIVGDEPSGPSLLEALSAASFSGRTLGVAALSCDPRLVAAAVGRGANVRVLGGDDSPDSRPRALLGRILGRDFDAIAFGSSREIDCLFEAAAPSQRAELAHALRRSNPVALGQAVARALSERGVPPSGVVERASLLRPRGIDFMSVFGAGTVTDGKPYVAMQYIDGVTLRSQIFSDGMDVKRAAAILKQIGAALGHIHNKGVLHRDLKPENIMIQLLSDDKEVVKILDFGIAKLRDPVAATSTVNTVAIGTIAYISPEQLREGERITAASDIYSMAVVACEMVTGKRPPVASQDRPINAPDLPSGLTKNARRVLTRALSFEPNDRYQDAKHFGDDLAKALLDGKRETVNHLPPRPPLTKSLVIFGATLILALLSYGIYKYVVRPPVPPPSKSFKYWLMVQRIRDEKEYETPFKSNGDAIFESSDRFQLNVSTTESGYLYIFNEGPPEPDAASFKMIYPNRATNNGSASVGANQTVQSDWITFRGPAGAENFWIVWSVSPVNELEIARNETSNSPQQGFVGDHLVSLKEFLKTMEAKVDSRTSRYKENQVAIVRGKTDILVALGQFKHR